MAINESDLLAIAEKAVPLPAELDALRNALAKDPTLANRELRTANGDKTNLLYTACRAGNHLVVGHLISAGADPNIRCWGGNTPFLVACYRGHLSCIEAMCWRKGVVLNLNTKNLRGENWEVFDPSVSVQVRAAIRSAMVSEQYFIMDDSCQWLPVQNQRLWAESFAKGRPFDDGNLSVDPDAKMVKDTAANGLVTLRPIMVLSRDSAQGVLKLDSGLPRMWSVSSARGATPVDLQTALQLEDQYRDTPERLLTIGQLTYQWYTPLWFYRDPQKKGWVPIDMNTNNLLEMSFNQGLKTFRTYNRVFDFDKLTATELATNAMTQVIHISERGVPEPPSSVDVEHIIAWSAPEGEGLRDRLAKALDVRTPADLKQALASPSLLEGNLALINICVNVLNCTVKGGAVRDTIVRGIADDHLKDIDCEMSIATWTESNVYNVLAARKKTMEQDLQLQVEVQTRPSRNAFTWSHSPNADIFTLKVKYGPGFAFHTEIEMIAPWCEYYYPPRNVDFTANNLAIRALFQPGLYTIQLVVPVPNVDAFTTVKSLLANPPQTMPVYDVKWESGGGTDGVNRNITLLACAPKDERCRVMNARIEKMRKKGFHIVEQL
jgi:hypothetical protein